MEEKHCIVYGCTNKSSEGRFIGDLCVPCYEMLSTGKFNFNSSNLVVTIANENKKLKEQLKKYKEND